MEKKLTIGMLIFPNFTQLDFTGPYEVLARLKHFFGDGIKILILTPSDNLDPVIGDTGLAIIPTKSLYDAPTLDVLFIPGGPGVVEVMKKKKNLDALRDLGNKAKYVTAVCTGTLILGVCGLLKGFKVTTHWMSMDLVHHFRAIPCDERVVIDRNRITGGGVTAGIDFGLRLVTILYGEPIARYIQLLLEYNPDPPYDGHPDKAPIELVEKIKADGADMQAERLRTIIKLVEQWD